MIRGQYVTQLWKNHGQHGISTKKVFIDFTSWYHKVQKVFYSTMTTPSVNITYWYTQAQVFYKHKERFNLPHDTFRIISENDKSVRSAIAVCDLGQKYFTSTNTHKLVPVLRETICWQWWWGWGGWKQGEDIFQCAVHQKTASNTITSMDLTTRTGHWTTNFLQHDLLCNEN
jgi:hypothetical protein